ncbi:hypothetical protein HU200_025018 [Digitaria exilis]|uniref:BHLH domain-containing protein n=1 Tax=Digitaria exilis TaxID=1010633 RepID=A0A835C9D5_9POAL|nr:hypothetical protein HU200_025018 [Digitaria exilis]CAB3501222.1 unnamed protein product [Digitaria exilis]
MWNCSGPHPILLPYGDDYVRCESSSSSAGAAGLDRILPAEYDLCHSLNLSPSLNGLQTPTLFAMNGSENYLGIGANPIYSVDEARPVFPQFSCTQPTSASHLVKWTSAGETMTSDGSRLRGSKRHKTTTAAETAQGPQHGLRCNAKPTRNQTMKAPCRRTQKLGDKITALQQLVSPYGKTDTASVLHEAATCIKQLHEQIQILTASYSAISSPASQQEQDIDEEEGTSDLRRRGLCLAPLSPDVVQLVVSAEAALRHRNTAETGDRWRWLGAL